EGKLGAAPGRKVALSSVTVVVPCYNYARFLPGCLRSVLSQQGVELTVLVLDDASSDDTYRVATEAAAADPRVAVVHHERNKGNIATFNEGLAASTSDYTALVSADDLLVPGALCRAAQVLDEHPEVGFVYGRSVYFETDDALPPARAGAFQVDLWPGRDWIARRCRTATSCISSPEVVVRTSLQHQIGGYRADLPCASDVEMWLRFAAHANVAYVRGADQAYYRVHSQSMLRQTLATSPLTDLRQRRDAYAAFFRDWGARVPAAGALQARANRALAREALWGACRAYDRHRYDSAHVAAFEAFASEIYPAATRLPEHWGLAWRKRLGPDWCPRLQPVLVSAMVRHVRNRLWWRHWRNYGV
ncbi:MAG TPA: glycosyltransferase, partial [Actinomycetota bacterium]|nr:glycosyltransferase [Actinomycetota bacterium]